MTTTTDNATATLHAALERQYRVYIDRLAALTGYRNRPDRGGYPAGTLDALIAWARNGVADTAHALQRMSDGSYGVCERCGGGIAFQRLRGQPEIRSCGDCRAAPPA